MKEHLRAVLIMLCVGLTFFSPLVAKKLEKAWGLEFDLTLGFFIGFFLLVNTYIHLPVISKGRASLAVAGALKFTGGLLAGFVLLAIVPCLIYLIEQPQMHVTFAGAAGLLKHSLILIVAGALLEELIFRGILLHYLEKLAGTVIALFASSLLFGLVHLSMTTIYGAVAIGLTGGFLLGLLYIATRSLCLVWGFHVGVNVVFGLVEKYSVTFLSGSEHGLSASPLTFVVVCVTGLLVFKFLKPDFAGWRSSMLAIFLQKFYKSLL